MADHQLRTLPSHFLTLDLPDEAATAQLANDIAMILKAGDVLCLSGDLGAGKSTLSRALIRSFAADPELEVPSPTFTLVQTYEIGRFDLSHFDLFRLEEPEELEELGLEDLLENGAALIEWPEKAGEFLPDDALWIQITEVDASEDARHVVFSSIDPDWESRLQQTLEIRAFLEKNARPEPKRQFLAGDASLRTFETVVSGETSFVLMRWPFQEASVPDAVRSYMETVHLANDCRSVLAIGTTLRDKGFLAPQIFAADVSNGLIMSQDLGAETIVRNGEPVPERYHAAVDVLAAMHSQKWPETIVLKNGDCYTIPLYSNDALIKEASLFLDWYLPEKTGVAAHESDRASFEALWNDALENISSAQTGWVLRDFHSPNLLWQKEATGTDQIGLIDFQDTVIGPIAYDVASLLLDARTDISPELEKELFDVYVTARKYQSDEFDTEAFLNAYAVMAAQRISKILGIFVRLARRDSKPAYLGHLPRMEGYLDRVLEKPILSDLRNWYAGLKS
ncbi:MAG: tRNA (adenosine(37)-N6)-threonylcarbamoyltransferase complex ATPase subunit type 1 TsaE [Roseibium sp.]